MSIQSITSLGQRPAQTMDTLAQSQKSQTQARPVAQGESSAETRDSQANASASARASSSSTGNSSVAPQELQAAVDSMNDFVSSIRNPLNFSIDKDTGQTIVKVIDQTTDEVIKQIPSEEMLAIAKAIDKLKGLFIQQEA